MKISHTILLGFLFILIVFSFTTYINYNQSKAVKDNAEYVSTSSVIVRQSNRFQRNILNIVSGIRGYLLTGDKTFVQAYDSAVIENDAILDELKPLVAEDSAQSAILNKIIYLRTDWLDEFSQIIKNTRSVNTTSDSTLSQLSRIYKTQFLSNQNNETNQQLQTELRNFINNEYSRREDKKAMLADSVQETRYLSFYLTLFSIIAGLIIAISLARNISNRILKMVNMANTIAGGNYKVHMKDLRNDELGKLAGSLNHMANVLDENFTLLQEKNAELDQFAHIVSHDLKAPLRGLDHIVSWIEEDHEAELTPKVQEYIQLMKGRLIRAENLIGGLLSYARVGKEQQQIESVDVRELINEIIETLAVPAHISITVSSHLPVLISERLPLFQVFSNLLSNAIKYNDKKQGIVTISHKEYEKFFEFSVADNGPGIASNYHNKIFVIFQTLQARDSFESTGVGLAIVKKILNARNENISVQSVVEEGSTFTFTWAKK